MSATAITLILIAAVAHASWNLFSKQAAQTGAVSFIWLAATAATLLYIPVIAIAWAGGWLHLTALGWVFMAGTGVLQSAYFVFLQSGYRLGDLSLVYPVGRGTGALLAAVAGIAFLGERPGPVAIGGIIAVVAGIALVGAPTRAPGPEAAGAGAGSGGGAGAAAPAVGPAIGFALATGVFIACYTLWDKYAVATLGTSALLQGYAAFPFMAAVFALPCPPGEGPDRAGVAPLPGSGGRRGRAHAAGLHPGAGRAELHRGQRGRPGPRGQRAVRGAARRPAAG